MQLPISNVITVSLSQIQSGLGLYNTSNVALFTTDLYNPSSFGSAGYSTYLEPSQLGPDFGTSSETFLMGNSLFSQAPNILANGGYLAVIPLIPATENIGFSGVPVSGSVSIVYGSQTAVISYNDATPAIQTALQALTGLSQAQVTGSISASGSALKITMYGFYGTPAVFTVGSNTLATMSGSVTVTPAITGSGEVLSAAITRTTGLVQYFGITVNALASTIGSVGVLAAAAVVQALNKIAVISTDESADLGSPSGLGYALTTASYTKTRLLYYGAPSDPLVESAGYAGRGFSTNFAGSDTTQTMHLKQLVGTQPDSTMTQTLLNQAAVSGVDTYVSLQGVPAVFSQGANQYFDQVYGLEALVGALSTAGFNYLALTSTKIPQTEQGMTGLKGAYRAVCEQFVGNGLIAPGAWTSSTTFGNQTDFFNNITTVGYYIFSQPVSQQSPSARVARQAPLIQIAIKLAGAIQSSSVLVVVNP